MNKQKDRLAELVDKAKKEYASDVTDHTETEYIVECLLNESVIVPPSEHVYFIVDKGTKYAMAMPKRTEELPLYKLRDLEKYGYYLSKEEAERRL